MTSKKTVYLGINCSGFSSSACLIINGKISSAISEERLTRKKNDPSFPLNAIKYCCSSANIKLEEIDKVYIGWNPRYYIHKEDLAIGDAFRERGQIYYYSVNNFSKLISEKLNKSSEPYIKNLSSKIETVNGNWEINFIDHHNAHLSNSFLLSGYDKSDFLILDGFGENSSGMIGKVNKNNINVMNKFRTPHSLGLVYSAFTDYLGFRANSDEWKVMALSSLGNSKKYSDIFNKMIKVDNLNFEVDLSYFENVMFWTNNNFSPKLINTFGDIPKNNNLKQRHYDIVASLQKKLEEVVIKLLNNLNKKTASKNIVLSGGFFMNSLLNGKIQSKTNYKNVFIGASPDDSGISIGSALYATNYINKKNIKNINYKANYYGKSYENQNIEILLKRTKIKYSIIKNPSKIGAKIISEGKVLAWFQGKSEFGQRALGNRSILGDPSKENIKDLINQSIKYREYFRPFAPAVMKEHVNDVFKISNDENSYFMEKVYKFKSKWIDKIPGVVHYDLTGRLQTVDKASNNLFYKLIKEFYILKKIPLVLNTSFNINGMPLVESPEDAIECFYKSGIDCLIIQNYLITK